MVRHGCHWPHSKRLSLGLDRIRGRAERAEAVLQGEKSEALISQNGYKFKMLKSSQRMADGQCPHVILSCAFRDASRKEHMLFFCKLWDYNLCTP